MARRFMCCSSRSRREASSAPMTRAAGSPRSSQVGNITRLLAPRKHLYPSGRSEGLRLHLRRRLGWWRRHEPLRGSRIEPSVMHAHRCLTLSRSVSLMPTMAPLLQKREHRARGFDARWRCIYGHAKWMAHQRRPVPFDPRAVPLLSDQTRKSPRAHVVHVVETARPQRHRTGYRTYTDHAGWGRSGARRSILMRP